MPEQLTGGKWVTINAKSGHGTHVYIVEGKIVAGAKSLQGKSIDALHEDTEWGKRAKEEKVDYKHLRQLAAEIQAHTREAIKDKQGVLKRAKELGAHYGVNLDRSNPVFRTGAGDWTQIPNFDVIAREVAGEFPHVLGAHGYEHEGGDETQAAEKLFGILAEGQVPHVTRREALEEAMKLIKEGHGQINFDEAVDEGTNELVGEDLGGDTSFDFGENEKSFTRLTVRDLSVYAHSFRQIHKSAVGESSGDQPKPVGEPIDEHPPEVAEFREFLEELGYEEEIVGISDDDLALALKGTTDVPPAPGQPAERPDGDPTPATPEQPADVPAPDASGGPDLQKTMLERLMASRGPGSMVEPYIDEQTGRIALRDLITGQPVPADNSVTFDPADDFLRKSGAAEPSRGNPKTGNAGQFGPGGVAAKQEGAKGEPSGGAEKPAGGGSGTASEGAGGSGPAEGAGQGAAEAAAAQQAAINEYEPQDVGDGILMSPYSQKRIGPILNHFFPGQNLQPQDLKKMVGAPEGMPIELSVTASSGYLAISITGKETDQVEMFGRALVMGDDGKPYMKNDLFFVKKDAQSSGLGRQVFANQVADLIARGGVSHIDTFAERFDHPDPDKAAVGYAVWPLMGYDGDISGEKAAQLPPELAGATTLGELYDKPGGREWWTEHGESMQLKFDLSPHSDSMKRLNNYLLRKGQQPIAQPRVAMETPPTTPRPSRADRISRLVGAVSRPRVTKSGTTGWDLYRAAWEIMAEDVLLPLWGGMTTKSICEFAEERSIVNTADPEMSFLKAYQSTIADVLGEESTGEFMRMGQGVKMLLKSYDGDSYDSPRSKFGSREDEAADFKVARQGYSVYAPGKYTPCGRTVRQLAPGIYQCFTDMQGNARFVRKEVEVDELIRFPDSLPDKILQEVKEFWGREDLFKRYGFLFRRGYILYGKPGCHAAGTKILMYDGTQKSVEDVSVGDKLMGPDSRPREVLRLVRGEEEMCRIIPVKGEPFVVNMQHILHLVPSGKSLWIPCPINISVADYLRFSKPAQEKFKLCRYPVVFSPRHELDYLPVPPYIMGVWLGDGTQNAPAITNVDEEIIREWRAWASELGVPVRQNEISHSASDRKYNKASLNPVREAFEQCGVLRQKSIPQMYLTASRDERLELIAGLLDTDGSLYGKGVKKNSPACCYDFVNKSESIADGLVFLCRSVGLAAYKTGCVKGCWTKNRKKWVDGNYFRVIVSGETQIIPCRVARKVAATRKQIKDVRRTGFTVEMIGKGSYYGFTLDSDHLYLTADFVAHHNCGKSACLNQIMQGVVDEGDVVLLCHNPGDMISCVAQLREIEPERRILVIMEDLDTIIHRFGEDDLLNWLDGQMAVNRLVCIATTNYLNRLPPRLVSRPRRFDRVVEIPPPDERMRNEFFGRKVPELTDKERAKWVKESAGLPFASLAEIVISVMCLGMSLAETIARLRIMDGPARDDDEGPRFTGRRER